MKRAQRAAHARLWILLAVILAGVFAAALNAREHVRAAQAHLMQGPR